MARIEVEVEGAVARLSLSRPEVRNALDGPMVQELLEAVRRLDGRDEVRVVVIRGRGSSFCAGADLAWMKAVAGYGERENVAEARTLASLFEAIDASPKAVVACVHGAALGGGVGLVAVADVALASDDAVFAFSEVRLGLVPAVIAPYVVRKIGYSAARALFVSGERFSPARAAAIGLVQRVVPEAELEDSLERCVRELLCAAPGAVAVAKGLLRSLAGCPSGELRDVTAALIASRRASAEGQEGLAAFLEKRKPSWCR